MFEGVGTNNAQNWTKDFLLEDAVGALNVNKDRWLHKVALGVIARHITLASEYACCFGLADLDVRQHLVELTLIDHRTNLCCCICQSVTKHDVRCLTLEFFHESVVNILVQDQAARGRAALSGCSERAPQHARKREVHIGIRHHDLCILATHFKRHLLVEGATPCSDRIARSC